MKTKITALILLAFLSAGCVTALMAGFSGANTAYNGLQEYRVLKQNVKEIRVKNKMSRLSLPPDPWVYLTHCSCDSGTYCLSDEDYMRIISYNEALRGNE